MAKLNLKKLSQQAVQAHKICLYIRVSTEEQASNPEGSIKSQEQRLRSHVEFKNQESNFGEVVHVFVDRARSGKDTKRPELQKLLLAISRREVSLVMVTELSRLSRSIKDVCEIWELMRENGCEFLSLREQFDTTTAAGEMVLYTIANIAQFERKQTSERIVANFQARAERGLFNGGSVPFGFKRNPDKKGYLFVDEKEAEVVREAYKTFINEGCLSKTGKSLNERGFRLNKLRSENGGQSRLGVFTIDNLHDLLTNQRYVGLRNYKSRSGEVKTSKACWSSIVDDEIFKQVQHILKKNRHSLKTSSSARYPYQLSGMTFCGICHDTLIGKSANGNSGKVAYYEHSRITKNQSCLTSKVFSCRPHRFQAKKIEPHVWQNVLSLLLDPKIAEDLIAEAQKLHKNQSHVTETDKLRNKIHGIDGQLEALAEHLSQIPKGVSPTRIFTQMQILEDLKTETKADLDKILSSGKVSDVPASLKNYKQFCELIRFGLVAKKDEDLIRKIIKTFVHKIELLPESYKLHLYVGQSHLDMVQAHSGAPRPEAKQLEKQNKKAQENFSLGPSENFLFGGSNRLTNGWGGRTRTCE